MRSVVRGQSCDADPGLPGIEHWKLDSQWSAWRWYFLTGDFGVAVERKERSLDSASGREVCCVGDGSIGMYLGCK